MWVVWLESRGTHVALANETEARAFAAKFGGTVKHIAPEETH